MTLVTPDQISPGDEITASSINTPIDQLADVINGGIDDTNISGVNGSKVADGTLPGAKFADNSVTTAKLSDRAVTSEKLTPTVGFYATTTQTLTSGATTPLTTYTEVVDYGSDFAAGVFTAPVKGFYHFDVNMRYENPSSSTDARIECALRVNGVDTAYGHGRGDLTTSDPTATIGITLPLNAGDAVDVTALQITGGTESLSTSYFSGSLEGAVA